MKRYAYWVLFLGFFGLYVASRLAAAGTPAAASPGPAPSSQSYLAIEKEAHPPQILDGGSISFWITVYNSGPVAQTDVVISDTVPAGTTYYPYPFYSSCTDPVDGVVHCPIPLIPARGSTTVIMYVEANQGLLEVVNDQYCAGAPGVTPACGAPVVVPVVTPQAWCDIYPAPTCTPIVGPTLGPTTVPSPGPKPTWEPVEPAPTPPGAPHLVLTQEEPSQMLAVGGEVTLRFAVTNDGTAGARDVVLAVPLPAGLAPGQVTVSPEAAHEWTGNTLWVAWGYLEAGATASVELHAPLLPGASGSTDFAVSIPDYGVESHAVLDIQPQVLPDSGTAPTPWWGWVALAGALLAGGLLLREYVRRGPREVDREEGHLKS